LPGDLTSTNVADNVRRHACMHHNIDASTAGGDLLMEVRMIVMGIAV
jgi:hypothetical protein